MAAIDCESRRAFRELIDALEEIDRRYLGEEWLIGSPADVAEGMRAVMHLLQGGLASWFEDDPEHPSFRRIVTPTRKFTGDNADAIYYEAPLRADRRYVVRGNMAEAVYVSLTIEAGASDGRFGTNTAGAINDTQFDVSADGLFEVFLGGPPRERNWIGLPGSATRITTRHYYEDVRSRAADTTPGIRLEIEVLDPVEPPPPYGDESVSAGIRRVINFMHSRTIGMEPPGQRRQPPFVSQVPNEFVPPVKPGDFSLAAADAAYTMTLYMLGPDQALVMSGRWPEVCRCASVSLWNRHMQTFDYCHRHASLNRKQTVLEEDGSFRMVLAHQDPGVPNWLDTEGRGVGMIFWRFMLAEGDIETPRAQVVPFTEVARGGRPG